MSTNLERLSATISKFQSGKAKMMSMALARDRLDKPFKSQKSQEKHHLNLTLQCIMATPDTWVIKWVSIPVFLTVICLTCLMMLTCMPILS